MKNEDNSIFEIDRWLKWLQRAAYVGIGVFAVILIAYAIKFRAFNDGIKAISNLPDDWSAFGSVLSGSSSLLGAVGTVGVMLLGIKQFKVQQQQINDQKKRQDDFELRQQQKWDQENEMLSFQKYQMHVSLFESLLTKIEAEHPITFNDKLSIYQEFYPSNSFIKTDFSFTNKSQHHRKLDREFAKIENTLVLYSRVPSAKLAKEILISYRKIKLHLSIDPIIEINNNTFPKIELNYFKDIVGACIYTFDKICHFSKYEKSTSSNSLNNLCQLMIRDIKFINNEHFSKKYEPFFIFLFLAFAAIKHDPSKHPELFNLITKNYIYMELTMIHTLPIENSKLEEFKSIVLSTNLAPNEKQILITQLTECQTVSVNNSFNNKT